MLRRCGIVADTMSGATPPLGVPLDGAALTRAGTQVLSKAHGRVQVQFLNKKDRKKDPTTNLKLVWYRTVPSSNVFDEGATDEHAEVYVQIHQFQFHSYINQGEPSG